MKKYIVLGSLLAFTPLLTFAVNFGDILGKVSDALKIILPILISLAVIFFVYSLLMYILKEGEEKAKAKTQMIWGIIILFVMISVWGLVDILVDTFNLDTALPKMPVLPTSTSIPTL